MDSVLEWHHWPNLCMSEGLVTLLDEVFEIFLFQFIKQGLLNDSKTYGILFVLSPIETVILKCLEKVFLKICSGISVD